MNGISVGELVKRAKGEDRSLREYARDSGVDAAILSKIINGRYIPKKPGIYEALTSRKASPRGGVTYQLLMEAAGTSEEYQSGLAAGMSMGLQTALNDIPSSDLIRVLQARGIASDDFRKQVATASAMKPEEIRKLQRINSETLRFAATANGILLGYLGKRGLTFQIVHTEGTEVDGIHFDTYIRLMNHEVSEFLIRYAFFPEEEASSLPLAKNTLRKMVEELVFLRPSRERIISVVTNHTEAYHDLCGCKDQLSFNGELTVILFDHESATLLKEAYISHYTAGKPVEPLILC